MTTDFYRFQLSPSLAEDVEGRARRLLRSYRHKLDDDDFEMLESLRDNAYEHLKRHRQHEEALYALEQRLYKAADEEQTTRRDTLMCALGERREGHLRLPKRYLLEAFVRDGVAYVFFDLDGRVGMTTEPAAAFPSAQLIGQLRMLLSV